MCAVEEVSVGDEGVSEEEYFFDVFFDAFGFVEGLDL